MFSRGTIIAIASFSWSFALAALVASAALGDHRVTAAVAPAKTTTTTPILDPWLQTVSNALQMKKKQKRQLQGGTTTVEQICQADGTVELGDNALESLYRAAFQSVCECTDNSNIQEFVDLANSGDLTAIETALQNLRIDIQWSCENKCDACFPESNDCGRIDIESDSDFSSIPGLTLADLVALGPMTDLSAILTGTKSLTVCIEYTVGQEGRVCMTDTRSSADLETPSERDCVLSVDNVNCRSCTITAEGCWTADCSNINGESANINSCAGTGVDGRFQMLPYLSGQADGSTLTLGSCGTASVTDPAPVSSAQTPASVPAPVRTPVTAPARTPASVPSPARTPVTAPARTPASVPAPVRTPVTGSVTAPARTPASVPAPIRTPVSTPGTAPAQTPGSVPAPIRTPVTAPGTAPAQTPASVPAFAPARPPVEGSTSAPVVSLAELVSSDPQLTTLLLATEEADLSVVLEGLFEGTIFAPTNQAFLAIDPEYLRKLLTRPYIAHLQSLITMHAMKDTVWLSRELVDGTQIQAMNGEFLFINRDATTREITIDSTKAMGSVVVDADLLASNGVVHKVDGVLLPGFFGRYLLDIAFYDPEYSIMYELLSGAYLLDVIPSESEVTLLLPTNSSLEALGEEALSYILDQRNRGELATLLQQHVLVGLHPTQLLTNGTILANLAGDEISVTIDGEGDTFFNGVRMVKSDQLSNNGIVHGIDGVLFDIPEFRDAPAAAPASSLVCATGQCTFRRVDTDGPAPFTHPLLAPIPYISVDGSVPNGSPSPSPSFSESPIFVGTRFADVVTKNATTNETATSNQTDTSNVTVTSPSRSPTSSTSNATNTSNVTASFPSLAPTSSPAPTLPKGYIGDGRVAPWTDPANQDRISDSVAITRDYRGGIFNALADDDYWNDYNAPMGTRWALLPEGRTFEEVRCELRFCSWLECFAQYDVRSMLNKPGVVHLIEEDEYYNIMFTNWTTNRGDDFMYKSMKLRPNQTSPRPETIEDARKRRLHYDEEARKSHRQRRLQVGVYYGTEPPCNSDDGLYGCEEQDYDYDIGELGGGFQYVRDQFPIAINSLAECPRCQYAQASPSEMSGPVDDSFVEVSIEGVTPDDVEILVLAIAQETNPRCNRGVTGGTAQVRPNAMGVGNSTAMLRRTLAVGSIDAMRYTIFFSATNDAGTCRGRVQACSPLEGLHCDDRLTDFFDATATEYCDA